MRIKSQHDIFKQLLNQHPEQFQNVDPYFFADTLESMQQTIATQKAIKRL